MRRWLIILLTAALPAAGASELIQVTWATKHASPPPALEPKAAALLPAFRMAVGSVPESTIIGLALAQPALLGLTTQQAQQLQPLVAEQYRQIESSEIYKKAPSLLGYCFSEATPSTGMANVHVPDDWKSGLPVMVFLHGYGGSFLWYQHYLSRHFPKHLIICPAWGISPSKITPAYLSECLSAVETRLRCQIKTPWLLGLSAGGFGVLRAASMMPDAYAGVICMAAYPVTRPPVKPAHYFIAGIEEAFVRSGHFSKLTIGCQTHLVKGAGHFFMLTHEDEAASQLKSWMRD
jgi:pimeloyl-ACP methyl ester carboxylesterase